MPRRRAAWLIFQSVSRRASSNCSRSILASRSSNRAVSSAAAGSFGAGGGILESPRIAAVIGDASASSVTRSMTLLSSLTLPGQWYSRRADFASADSSFGGRS